ncbi:unnamed protein product [Victoria cruziana]
MAFLQCHPPTQRPLMSSTPVCWAVGYRPCFSDIRPISVASALALMASIHSYSCCSIVGCCLPLLQLLPLSTLRR